MKKLLALTLAVLLAAPAAALGEAVTAVTANGVVESQTTWQITAPYSGVLLPFDWESGDVVAQGDALFEMQTTKVYSPVDGTLAVVFAEAGDLCEDVIAQYGMIASVEKDASQLIAATTSGRHSDQEDDPIHMGETVYFEQTSDTDNIGEGYVIAVSDAGYTVELTSGTFDLNDRVKLYRDANRGSRTCEGTGNIVRASDSGIQASGRVLGIAVSEGQHVRKGQLLFELASADAEADACEAVNSAPSEAVIGALAVASGQQVYKGQLLATLNDMNDLAVVAQVDEMDLDLVQVGGALTLVFDRYPNNAVTGTVTQISRMGAAKQNATYYDVTIAFTTSLEVLSGMNATVWLSGQP